MASIAARMYDVTPVVIERAVEKFTYRKDAYYRLVSRSTDRVVRGNGIGRDWKVLRPLTVGVAGAVKVRDINTTDEIHGNTNKAWVPKSVRTYPTLDEISLVGFDQLEMQLVETVGNFAFPIHLLRANGLPAVVVNVFDQNVLGVAENYALTELQSFYTASDSTQQLCSISGAPTFAGGSPLAASVALCTLAGGRIYNIRSGMFVDVYNAAGTVKRNPATKLLITFVDRVKKQFKIADPTGTTDLSALGIASTDLVVRADSFGKGLQGMDTWTKATGNILGVSVDEVPDLKSFVTSTGGILTETVLNNLIGDFFDAYGAQDLAGVATIGMINKHLDDLITFNSTQGMMTVERQGAALTRVPGFTGSDEAGGIGFVHVYGGMRTPIYASAHQISGQLNVMQVGMGNVKRYAPPRVRGMGQHESFGGEIEFILSYDGGGSIFGNATAVVPGSTSVAVSDHVWAPFSGVYNRMATRPQGIKSTGHTELAGMTYT